MGFFDLEDTSAVMPFTLWLLKVLGLRGSRWNFRRYQFAVFWICFVTLVPKTFLSFQRYRSNIDLMIRGVSELIFQANTVVKMVLIARKLPEFEKMLNLLCKWFRKTFSANHTSSQSMALAKCNRANDLFAKGYFVYCMVVVSLYNVGPVIQSTIIYHNYDPDNSTKPIELKTHMEQEFYWLNIRTNFVHYWCFSLCAMVSYVFSSYILVVQAALAYSCCKCCSNMFDVVSMRLGNLPSLKGDQQKNELKDIIEMHVDALTCVESLNEVCTFALIMQLFNCVLIWCSMAVYLTYNFNANAVNVLVLFTVVTAETYGICVLATELSQKSLDVQNAIYDFPWYEAPIGIRKSLLRMLQRAQAHVGVTAAGFCYVDIEQFGNLAQKSYSIYVVMKDTLTL